MYLHLGMDVVVRQKEVIAILDLDTTSVSKNTREFLNTAQKRGNVIDVSKNDLPKSYVLCGNKNDFRLYISPLSAQTIYKRAASKFMAE